MSGESEAGVIDRITPQCSGSDLKNQWEKSGSMTMIIAGSFVYEIIAQSTFRTHARSPKQALTNKTKNQKKSRTAFLVLCVGRSVASFSRIFILATEYRGSSHFAVPAMLLAPSSYSNGR